MKSIAIITARGGSKRIPGKNIKLFQGKPMLQYAIDAACKSECFDEIMVSTDDEQIAAVALSLNASVPFMRSADTSDDFATTSDVLDEVLNQYLQIGQHYQYACCLYPCVPFLKPNRLKEAYGILCESPQVEMVIPVCRYSTPIERALELDGHGNIGFRHPEFINTRSQDLKPAYYDSGQFYFFKTAPFLRCGLGGMTVKKPILIAETECQDIDNESDWEIAEFKYKLFNSYQKARCPNGSHKGSD